jgi:GNAT superfamily N-acetyltransferase
VDRRRHQALEDRRIWQLVEALIVEGHMATPAVVEVRDAELPEDRDVVERLWLEYLSWGNDELERRYGFRLPVREAIERDLATVEKFQPPTGRLVLALSGGHACGIGCLRRIGAETAEIKRMFVQPEFRGAGAGRAVLAALIAAAESAGYTCLRLDSIDFMTAAHALYRSCGFVDIGPYPESEIPIEYWPHWVFMERTGSAPPFPGNVAVEHHG